VSTFLTCRKQTRKEINKVHDTIPLYEQIEEKFKTDTIIPELERKKQVLKQIRQSFRPISLDEIKEHDINYQKMVRPKSSSPNCYLSIVARLLKSKS